MTSYIEFSENNIAEIKQISREKLYDALSKLETHETILIKANINTKVSLSFIKRYKEALCERLINFDGDVYTASDIIVDIIATIDHRVHYTREQLAGCIASTAYCIHKTGITMFCKSYQIYE